MPYVEIIGGLLTLLTSIIGFYVKRAYTRMDEMQNELTKHRLEDVKEYVPRQELQAFAEGIRRDLQSMVNPIHVKLQSIEESLRDKRKDSI